MTGELTAPPKDRKFYFVHDESSVAKGRSILALVLIGAGGADSLGRRVPEVQVHEDPFDDLGIVNERDDAHRGTAVAALERVDLVDFLNQPGPVGSAPSVDRSGIYLYPNCLREAVLHSCNLYVCFCPFHAGHHIVF